MKSESENKLNDHRKAESIRRTELAMLGLLIEKYPREAKEKTRKLSLNLGSLTAQINKSL